MVIMLVVLRVHAWLDSPARFMADVVPGCAIAEVEALYGPPGFDSRTAPDVVPPAGCDYYLEYSELMRTCGADWKAAWIRVKDGRVVSVERGHYSRG